MRLLKLSADCGDVDDILKRDSIHRQKNFFVEIQDASIEEKESRYTLAYYLSFIEFVDQA
jgi:hypothetical protein